MKDMLIPIDQAGRIVLPKDVREELSIKAGDTFKVSIHGTAVILTPNAQPARFIRKGKALVFSAAGGETLTSEAVRNILDDTRQDRDSLSLQGFTKKKRAT